MNDKNSFPASVIRKSEKEFKVLNAKHMDFWDLLKEGAWEPETFSIFDKFISSDSIFLDIGSWIGPTALYAAQLAKHVYAFEPDPVAFKELKANMELNRDAEWSHRITIFNKAIAGADGKIKLGSMKNGGDSESSLLFSGERTSWEIDAITLKHFVKSENIQNEKLFIKMDIEGGEYKVIPGARPFFLKHSVSLLISLHPNLLYSHIIKRKGINIFDRIFRRLIFVFYQAKLLRGLAFRYLYSSKGIRINRYVEILKSLVSGKFLENIVATNKEWVQLKP